MLGPFGKGIRKVPFSLVLSQILKDVIQKYASLSKNLKHSAGPHCTQNSPLENDCSHLENLMTSWRYNYSELPIIRPGHLNLKPLNF